MKVSLIGDGIVATLNATQCTFLHFTLPITNNSKNSNNKRKPSWSEFWFSVENPMHIDNKYVRNIPLGKSENDVGVLGRTKIWEMMGINDCTRGHLYNTR